MPPSTDRSASRLCGGVRSPRSEPARSARSARVSRSEALRSDGAESAIGREPGADGWRRVYQQRRAARAPAIALAAPKNTTRCLARDRPRHLGVDTRVAVALPDLSRP